MSKMVARRGVKRFLRCLAVVGFAGSLLCITAGTRAYWQAQPLNDGWRWAGYSTDDGLPDNRITAVTVAKNGRTWVGTAAGVAWFDGYVWHRSGDDQGIPARPVAGLSQDGGDGVLAIVHNRLYQGNAEGFRHLPIELDWQQIDPERKSGVTEHRASSAASTPDGQIFVILPESNARSLLVRMHEGAVELTEPPAPLDVNSRLSTSRQGDPLLGTMRGLYRWRNGAWAQVIVLDESGTRFSAAAENEHGEGLAVMVDLVTSHGLVTWDGGGLTLASAEGANPIRSLDIGPAGDATVIYETGHIRVRTDGRWGDAAPTPPEVRESARVARYTADGDIWIGTARGLFLYRAGSSRWTTREFPFPDQRNRVHALLRRPDGSIWTGTGDGLVVHRLERGTPESVREILGVRLGIVTGLAEDGFGNVWVTSGASFHGAFRWNGRQWRRYTANDGLAAPRIHRVVVDRAGRPWFLGLAEPGHILTGPGAFVLSEGRFERWGEEEGLPSGRVYDFAEQPDGTRWFVTINSVSRLRGEAWTHWDRWRTTLASGRRMNAPISPRSIASGPDRVWIGDPRFGLATIDENDELQFVATVGEPPGRVGVEDVQVEPDGTVWITSTAGLCSSKDGDWSCLDQTSGLATAALWPILVTPQHVYVGTLGRGLQVLNRAEERNPYPRLQLVDPLVEGRNALFRWTAHTLRGAIPTDRIRTRHRIDDGRWSAWSTLREATAHNLTPGLHVVDLQAQALFGGRPPTNASVEFRVPLPLLLRPAVMVPLGSLLVVILLIGAAVLRQRRNYLRDLRDSEARFRALGQAAFEGIGFGETSIIEANDCLAEMFGYSREEMHELDITALAAPRSLPMFQQLLQQFGQMTTENPAVAHELWAVRKDGSEFPVEVQVKAMPHEGRLVRVVAVRDMTAQRDAEAALRTSEEKFAKAFMMSPDAVDLARLADGRFIDVNDAFLELAERERADTIGRSGKDLGLWVNDSEHESYWTQLREGGSVRGFECQLRARGGRIRDCVISAERIDVAGEPSVLAVTRDITEQKRVTRALRTTQFAVDHAADCVFWLDADARIRYANEAASTTYGYSREELVTMTVFDISDELTPDMWPASWAKLREHGSFMRISFHRDRNQRRFPVELVSSYVSSEGEEHAVVFARDISERVAAERALRDSEEKFAKAFQSSPNAIAITEIEDGRIIDVNDEFLRQWFRTREEMLGRTAVEIGAWSDDAEQELRNRILTEGRVSGMPLRINAGLGEERLGLLFAEAIDLGGEQCMLTVVQDITERERTNLALERSRQELRVLSRRLMEAQEAERGRISRELHDEIGQALATVKLNLQAIKRMSNDEKVTEQVQDGIAVVDRAVVDVRNLSRDLRPSVLDDLGLGAALRWLIKRMPERADIAVGLEIAEPGFRPVMEIETACYRIAQEGLTNVLRHARATRVDITLATEAEELVLRIRDDGRGFDLPSENEPQPADGHLGLIGMRERAANAGGNLVIRSALADGAEVEARFPLDPFSAGLTAGTADSHPLQST